MESTSEDTLISSSAVRRIFERLQSERSSIRILDANEDPDGDWPVDDHLQKSLLHVAAETGDAPMVQALLAVGASADFENEWGWTALQFATATGHAECVRLLLEAGADANYRSELLQGDAVGTDWFPALCLAVDAGCMAHLLKWGAHVDQKCDYGMAPLHFAAGSNCKLKVEYLIRAGANVNLLTRTGDSAFMLSLNRTSEQQVGNSIENRHILGMLLRAGATIDLDALRDHVAIGSDAPTWRYARKLVDAGGYEAFVQIYRRVLTAPRSAITRFLKNKFGRGAPPGVAAIILAFWKPPGGY